MEDKNAQITETALRMVHRYGSKDGAIDIAGMYRQMYEINRRGFTYWSGVIAAIKELP
jgi:hypothetical protein